jgi:hypothetical protein
VLAPGKARVGMKRSKRSIVVGLTVVVAATVTGLGVVRAKFGCLPPPPRSERKMLEQFKADPVFTAAPYGGRLVEEHSLASACKDYDPGGSGPTPTNVGRLYRTSTLHSFDQLRQRFDQPAAAAGWHIDEAQTHPARWKAAATAAQLRHIPPHIRHHFSRPLYEPAIVTYCRQLGDALINAQVGSGRSAAHGANISVAIHEVGKIATLPHDIRTCPLRAR